MPVRLIHFSGVLNNETIHLQWQAEMETGFSHFNIQRSPDGINFMTVGKVTGAGNSHLNNYNYHDNDVRNRPEQKLFYRLQLMDKNGYFSYSKILQFNWKQHGPTLTVFPNPAVQSLNLSFEQVKTGMTTFAITDMKGAVVKKQSENLTAGRISLYIDVSTLPPAGYLISVINGEGTAVQQKFIKQ